MAIAGGRRRLTWREGAKPMRNGNGGTHEPDGDGELTAAMPDGDGEQARKAERTADDLIREMIAELDAGQRRAAELAADIERRQLDVDAAARRRRGIELLQ
jgi:hypothetical protein